MMERVFTLPREDTLLIVYPPIEEAFNILFEESKGWRKKVLHAGKEHFRCIYISPTTHVIWHPVALKYNFTLDREAALKIRQNILSSLNVPTIHPPMPSKTFIFIDRQNTSTRQLTPAVKQFFEGAVTRNTTDKLALKALKRNPTSRMRFVAYQGKETLEETIRLFASAAVVVGFHGAGLVNTIFAPADVVVMEMTFFFNDSYWRTNEWISRLCQQSHWYVYGVDVSHGAVAGYSSLNLTSMSAMEIDRWLKGREKVHVPRPDLANMMNTIDIALETLQDRSNNNKSFNV